MRMHLVKQSIISRKRRPLILGILHEGEYRRPEFLPGYSEPVLSLRKVDDAEEEVEECELPILDQDDLEVLDAFDFIQFARFWVALRMREWNSSVEFLKVFLMLVKDDWLECIVRNRNLPDFYTVMAMHLSGFFPSPHDANVRAQYEWWKNMPRQNRKVRESYKEKLRDRHSGEPKSDRYFVSPKDQRIIVYICSYGFKAVYHLARLTETIEKSRIISEKFAREAQLYIDDYFLGHIDSNFFSKLFDCTFRATSLAAGPVSVFIEVGKEIFINRLESALADLSAPIEGIAEENCSICISQFEEGQDCCTTDCRHHFHKPCLRRSLEEDIQCPNCRTSIAGRNENLTAHSAVEGSRSH